MHRQSRSRCARLCLVATLLATPVLAAEDQSFDVFEYRVLGNSVLPARVIEAAVYPFLGEKKNLQVVQQARDALTAAYRNAGYGTVFVDIPEQSVDEGIVRLKVTEGRVERVRVAGAKYYSERRIRDGVPSIKQGEVPQLPALQSDLARLAGEARDRQITPLLKAGSEPGTVAVDLNVKDQLPLHASLAVDNRYTADTSRERLTAVLSYENLWQRGDSVSLQYQTSPERTSEVRLWALTYLGRTWTPNLTWSAYAIRSDSNVAAIGTLSVIGNGRIFGTRLTDAWSPSITSWSSLSFGADYKDFGQTVNLADGASESPIHYLLWSLQYTLGMQHPSFGANGSVGLSFGLRDVVGKDAEFDFNRYNAQANFAYLRGGGALTYRFWREAAISLRYGFQYAPEPLITNEQFAIGGVDSVRGYLEAESLGDAGVNGGLEVRAPPLVLREARIVGYLFADAAGIRVDQPLPEQTSRLALYSAGVGLRASPFTGLDLALDLADPLNDGPRTRRNSLRVDFSLRYGR